MEFGKYQLVLQFAAHSEADFLRLVAFQDRLDQELGEAHFVDGNDFGLGKFNIFILTDDAPAAFEAAISIARSLPLKDEMRAAFRALEGDDYSILWPKDLKTFDLM
jgi:hypothetical protein